MALEALYPFAGAHAIQSAAFVAEWQQELTDDELDNVRSVHSELKGWTRSAIEQHGVQIAVGQPTGGQPMGNGRQVLVGVVFQRAGAIPGGSPGWQLAINRTSCQVNVLDYTRWGPVWEHVQQCMSAVFRRVINQRKLRAFGLQYTDVFRWRDDPNTIVLDEIFNRKSKYLVSNVFDLGSLWHCHHGFFEHVDKPITHRRLDNININCADVHGERTFAIVTSHKGTLKDAVWSAETADQVGAQIMPLFHDRNKEILADLLTEEVQAKIKLKGEARKND